MSSPRPCPFCGSSKVFVRGALLAYVECDDCDATGPDEGAEPCADAWNTRPHHDELVAMVAELSSELGNHCKCTGTRPAWKCHACEARADARSLLARVRREP